MACQVLSYTACLLLLEVSISNCLLCLSYDACRDQLSSGMNDVITFGQLTWLSLHVKRLTILNFFFARLEKELNECEREHAISHRWLKSDSQYKELEYSLLLDKQEQLLLELWKASQRRIFLLKLKKKYAGMCTDNQALRNVAHPCDQTCGTNSHHNTFFLFPRWPD